MMAREDFYAKTLVAQVKAHKRFGYDENLFYNALDTLQQARNLGIVSYGESQKVICMISDYLFNTHIMRGWLC